MFIHNKGKKFIEKSDECDNHKSQPNPDTKRKRKRTKINACEINKQMHEKHIDQLSPPQARRPQLQKDRNNMKTKSKERPNTKTHHGKNHKATQNKNKTRTTGPEQPAAHTTRGPKHQHCRQIPNLGPDVIPNTNIHKKFGPSSIYVSQWKHKSKAHKWFCLISNIISIGYHLSEKAVPGCYHMLF